MNITIQNATFVMPNPADDRFKSALTEAILGVQTEGDEECFFGNCDDEESGTTGDTEPAQISAVQSVLDAYDTANRLKQFDKTSTNDFWLLADTILQQYEGNVPLDIAMRYAVDTGKMLTKTSKYGNPLYKAA